MVHLLASIEEDEPIHYAVPSELKREEEDEGRRAGGDTCASGASETSSSLP